MSRPPRFFFWILLLLVAAGVATLVVRLAPSLGFDMSSAGPVRFVYLVAVLVFLGSALVGRVGLRDVMRAILGWGVILVLVVGGYAYRDELVVVGGRLFGVLAPGVPISGSITGEGSDAVAIMRNADGHFAVRAGVDGVQMTMLVDTGASLVTLTPEDAAAIGIDAATLHFTMPIQTANGLIQAAPITIRQISIGSIGRSDIKALVAPPGALEQSLLGMSFLNSLSGYSISGDRLVLKP